MSVDRQSVIPEAQNMRNLVIISLVLFNVCCLQAATAAPAATSPTKVVIDLYRAHKEKPDPLEYPASKKLLGAYFERHLLSLYLKDQTDSKGEVGKLDFDPLYDAQDFEIKDFSIVLAAQKDHGAEVMASFKNMGSSQKVRFLLLNTAEGWRISDVKYSDGRSLAEILK